VDLVTEKGVIYSDLDVSYQLSAISRNSEIPRAAAEGSWLRLNWANTYRKMSKISTLRCKHLMQLSAMLLGLERRLCNSPHARSDPLFRQQWRQKILEIVRVNSAQRG
jgi:hypothetical protein